MKKKTNNEEESLKKEETSEEKVLTPEEKIIELEAELQKYKNEFYRAYADMQNLRKTIEKDHREAVKYRAEGFIDELLPVLDGFHLALANPATSKEMENFLVGFSYIYKNLVAVLENEGVSELSPKIGDEFDPKTMQALETRLTDGEPNKVLEVKVKGYKLHDHLIRPSIVIVSTNKVEEEKEQVPEMDAQKGN